MNTTMIQFAISRVLEIFFPKSVMPKMTNRRAAPRALTVDSSPAVRARPKRSGKRLSPAFAAQPPQMKAR